MPTAVPLMPLRIRTGNFPSLLDSIPDFRLCKSTVLKFCSSHPPTTRMDFVLDSDVVAVAVLEVGVVVEEEEEVAVALS